MHLNCAVSTQADRFADADRLCFCNQIYTASVEADLIQMVVDIRVVFGSKQMNVYTLIPFKECDKITVRFYDLYRQFFRDGLAVIQENSELSISLMRWGL